MKIAYIAGPFRASNYYEQELNVRDAESVALELWRMGFAVICPHANTRFFQGAAPDRTFLDGDLELIRVSDCVVMIKSWYNSAGAREEYAHARRLSKPVFFWPSQAEAIRSCGGKS